MRRIGRQGDFIVPKSSLRQRKIEGRVMHEFAHGELKSGPGGKGGKVKSRRQAIAIAISEAGASNYQSEKKNRRNLARTERKEARGETAQQEKEGRSHVGARGNRESSPAMGGKNATRTTKSGRKAAHTGAVRAGQWCHQERSLPAGEKPRRRRALADDKASTGECSLITAIWTPRCRPDLFEIDQRISLSARSSFSSPPSPGRPMRSHVGFAGNARVQMPRRASPS